MQLRLLVDGVTKQDGNTKDMLFDVQELIGFCSSKMTLEAGDLLLTGTPKVKSRAASLAEHWMRAQQLTFDRELGQYELARRCSQRSRAL